MIGLSLVAAVAALAVGAPAADSRCKKTGRIVPAVDWAVTRKVSLAQGRFRIRRGRSAQVRLRFTASGGPVRLDDVYIDPRLRR